MNQNRNKPRKGRSLGVGADEAVNPPPALIQSKQSLIPAEVFPVSLTAREEAEESSASASLDVKILGVKIRLGWARGSRCRS